MGDDILTQAERRTYPRVTKKLPLKVKANSFDIAAETKNISSSGVYCQVNKYVELMTKVAIILLLPLKLKNNKIVTRKLNCEGVVVRVEKSKDAEGRFNLAIFFNNIKKADTAAITRYVNSHIRTSPPS